ncbi:response regulator [Legionella yabuuchiae]|uniref:response regulator n=1 Tax=Legionella yabuuchiae TaxID=376727 RepID=UPI001056A93C|nr:response regulator [Legionella yabuuchiae]
MDKYWQTELLQDLVNQLPAAIFWKDRNSVFLGCNQYFAQLAGLSSPQEIIGKTDYDLPWKKYEADLYRKDDQEVMKNKKPKLNIEEPQTLKDGTVIILLTNKIPLFSKPLQEVIGVLCIYHDITARKQMENNLKTAKIQAEAASRAKTEFLENMRHDIRTPLTGIVGFSEIIKAEASKPEIKEYADNLIASSHALLDLMDEVLEAVRVNSGEIPKLKKKFSLKALLQQVINLNKAKAASKRLELSLDYDEKLPKYVLGDNVRIHRMILELVANALNFTDSGFVRVKAECAKALDSKVILRLAVKDSGMGIPPEKQQEIFLQFKRLTPSYQGIYKGAGLGLAVIKQFIDDLGGEIYVESEVHRGATFTCIIPLQIPLLDDDTGVEKISDETTHFLSESLIPQKQTSSPSEEKDEHRILLVEDNAIAQNVAKILLKQFNCFVDTAEDGKTALQLWKENSYDLIFMDIGLLDMDGYQVTHHIRNQEAATHRHTPIIALTAHAGDENKQRAIEAGMNAVLTKPLTQKNCQDMLDSFIASRSHEKREKNRYLADLPDDEKELLELSPYPLLDVEEAVKTSGDEALLTTLLDMMINDSLPEDISQMKAAYDAEDWERIQKLAHKIKGGAVYVGTEKMKMACQYLERYYKSGQCELLEPLYQQMLQVIDETRNEILSWVKSQS